MIWICHRADGMSGLSCTEGKTWANMFLLLLLFGIHSMYCVECERQCAFVCRSNGSGNERRNMCYESNEWHVHLSHGICIFYIGTHIRNSFLYANMCPDAWRSISRTAGTRIVSHRFDHCELMVAKILRQLQENPTCYHTCRTKARVVRFARSTISQHFFSAALFCTFRECQTEVLTCYLND